MSDEVVSQAEVDIVESILAEAESRAQQSLDDARNIVEAEDEKVRREAEEARKDILAKGDEKVRRFRSRETATAHVEAQRILLRSREEAVAGVLTQIEEELKSLSNDAAQYKRSLRNLAVEAVLAVGEPAVRLKLGGSDRAFGNNEFLDAVKAGVRDRLGSELVIDLEFDQADLGGGCVAASPGGRVVFENTFPRRLERMKRQLRTSIVKEIAGNNE